MSQSLVSANLSRVWLAVLVAAATTGCASAEPVLRLTPLSNNVVWVAGEAAVIKEGKLARVAVAFARQQDDLVGFRIEIENTANAPILVDPSNFYYAACTRSADAQKRNCHPARWAVDPEKMLLALDIERSRQKANTMNAESLMAPILFLDLAVAVAGTASPNHRTTALALGAADLTAATLGAIQSDGQQQASGYELKRANWEAAAFRKTTLLPGTRAAGLVYVDRDLAANELALQIRIGDETLDFPFKQALVDARPPRAPNSFHPTKILPR